MQEQILVLSDLHIGSAYGVLPIDFLDVEGNVHTQNVGQQYLWQSFIHFLYRIRPRPIKRIVVNGDVLDGMPAKKSSKPTEDLTLHRLQDQREAAVKVLEEVRNRFPGLPWHFVSGTPNHELAEEVSQVAYLLLGSKQPIKNHLTLRIGQAMIRFQHEAVSFSNGVLKANALERAILNNDLASIRKDWPNVDAIISSHCHYFRTVTCATKLCLVTPCWELQTAFMKKKNIEANIPDLGAVILSVDDSLKSQGICPVGFTEYLYPHPAPEITDVTDNDQTVVVA